MFVLSEMHSLLLGVAGRTKWTLFLHSFILFSFDCQYINIDIFVSIFRYQYRYHGIRTKSKGFRWRDSLSAAKLGRVWKGGGQVLVVRGLFLHLSVDLMTFLGGGLHASVSCDF